MSASDVPTTRLESVEHIRESLAKRTPTKKESVQAAIKDIGVQRFRPCHRPPMALICLLHDGQDDGAWTRVHNDRLVVGRTEGDLQVPYEGGMSSRHFELRRELEGGRFRWYIKDLGSSNGTFARIGEAILEHRQEILIGASRFRFDAGAESPAARAAEHGGTVPRDTTQKWQTLPAGGRKPDYAKVIELTGDAEGKRIDLTEQSHWFGTDARSSIVVENDPYVEPRHAELSKNEKGKWIIKNNESLNGTWVRVNEIPIEKGAYLQAGEQRFLVILP